MKKLYYAIKYWIIDRNADRRKARMLQRCMYRGTSLCALKEWTAIEIIPLSIEETYVVVDGYSHHVIGWQLEAMVDYFEDDGNDSTPTILTRVVGLIEYNGIGTATGSRGEIHENELQYSHNWRSERD